MMKFDANALRALMFTKIFYFKLERNFETQKLPVVNVLKNSGNLCNSRFLKTSILCKLYVKCLNRNVLIDSGKKI